MPSLMPGVLADTPWSLIRLSKDALLKQGDDFAREIAKVDQNPLLNLQTLKFLLADLQCVEEEQILVTGKMYPQDLINKIGPLGMWR